MACVLNPCLSNDDHVTLNLKLSLTHHQWNYMQKYRSLLHSVILYSKTFTYYCAHCFNVYITNCFLISYINIFPVGLIFHMKYAVNMRLEHFPILGLKWSCRGVVFYLHGHLGIPQQ